MANRMRITVAFILIVFSDYSVSSKIVDNKQDFNDTFTQVQSLEEEDQRGLRGMSYNETQPPVIDPTEFLGIRIGFVASHCFEECELTYPWIYFNNRGATIEILAPFWVPGVIASCEFVRANKWAAVTRNFKDALSIDYQALIVPGGVWSSTVVRNDQDAIALIRQHYKKGKLLATTCSGSTVLIEAGYAKGTKLTGSPSIKNDLVNAGALYLDVPVVQVKNLITGRSPGGSDNQLWTESIANYVRKLAMNTGSNPLSLTNFK